MPCRVTNAVSNRRNRRKLTLFTVCRSLVPHSLCFMLYKHRPSAMKLCFAECNSFALARRRLMMRGILNQNLSLPLPKFNVLRVQTRFISTGTCAVCILCMVCPCTVEGSSYVLCMSVHEQTCLCTWLNGQQACCQAPLLCWAGPMGMGIVT